MVAHLEQSILSELADFLVSQPTLEEIAAYKVPLSVQQYVDELLDKNREGELSSDERLELDKIIVITDVLDLAKAKARLKLAGKK